MTATGWWLSTWMKSHWVTHLAEWWTTVGSPSPPDGWHGGGDHWQSLTITDDQHPMLPVMVIDYRPWWLAPSDANNHGWWLSPDDDGYHLMRIIVTFTEWWHSPSGDHHLLSAISGSYHPLMEIVDWWLTLNNEYHDEWVSWVGEYHEWYHEWWVVPSEDTRWVVGSGWLSWAMPVIFWWLSLSHDNHPLTSIIGWWLLLDSWISPDDDCHLMWMTIIWYLMWVSSVMIGTMGDDCHLMSNTVWW